MRLGFNAQRSPTRVPRHQLIKTNMHKGTAIAAHHAFTKASAVAGSGLHALARRGRHTPARKGPLDFRALCFKRHTPIGGADRVAVDACRVRARVRCPRPRCAPPTQRTGRRRTRVCVTSRAPARHVCKEKIILAGTPRALHNFTRSATPLGLWPLPEKGTTK